MKYKFHCKLGSFLNLLILDVYNSHVQCLKVAIPLALSHLFVLAADQARCS